MPSLRLTIFQNVHLLILAPLKNIVCVKVILHCFVKKSLKSVDLRECNCVMFLVCLKAEKAHWAKMLKYINKY